MKISSECVDRVRSRSSSERKPLYAVGEGKKKKQDQKDQQYGNPKKSKKMSVPVSAGHGWWCIAAVPLILLVEDFLSSMPKTRHAVNATKYPPRFQPR